MILPVASWRMPWIVLIVQDTSVLSVLGLWADAQRCTVLEKDHKQQSGSNRDNNDETMLGLDANNNNGSVSAPVLKATGRPRLLITGPSDRFL